MNNYVLKAKIYTGVNTLPKEVCLMNMEWASEHLESSLYFENLDESFPIYRPQYPYLWVQTSVLKP